MGPQPKNRDWPESFDSFPAHDNRLAEEWFTVPRNRDFRPWRSGVGNRVKHWSDLELAIQTITGQTAHMVCKCGKAAASKAWVGVDVKSYATDEQRQMIGDITGLALIEIMTQDWKTAATPWLTHACRAIAPRFIYLWKRRECEEEVKNKGKGKAIEERDQLEGTTDNGITDNVITENGITDNHAKRKNKITPAMAHWRNKRTHILKYNQKTTWIGRRIEVSVESELKTMLPNKQDDIFLVATTAIIYDHARGYRDEEIEFNDMSFDLFQTLLALYTLRCDLSRKTNALTYKRTIENKVEDVEIKDESGFHMALEHLSSEGLPDTLFMRVVQKQTDEQEQNEGTQLVQRLLGGA